MASRPRPRPDASELDLSPSRYIARVDSRTSREIPGTIDPEELLVHAHRDQHPAEVAAQFVASRVLGLTGRERVVRQGLRALTGLGHWVAGGVGAVTGSDAAKRRARQFLGVADRGYVFRFREHTHLTEKQVREKSEAEQEAARQLFVERLEVDAEIAGILVQEGFSTIEEIAYVPEGELLAVEEFDADIVAELRSRARDALLALYRAHPQVEAVFTKEEIARAGVPSGNPTGWSLIQRVRALFDSERSGDLYVVLKPHIQPISDTSRAT